MNSPLKLKTWANNQVGQDSAQPQTPGVPPPPSSSAPVMGGVSPKHMLTPEQSAWVSLDPRGYPRADNPPSWVDDEAAWEKAKATVKKDWDSYDEPWAVVATVYKNMTGG